MDTRKSTICHYHHVTIPGTEAEPNFDYNDVLDQLSTEMERARKHCEIVCKAGAAVHYISLLVQCTQQSEAQLQGKVHSVSLRRVVKQKVRLVHV